MPVAAALLYRVTVAPDSADPVSVGVVTFVSRSVDDDPLSLAALSVGAGGAVGAIVSMVTMMPADAGPRLPARSVARAVSV